MIIFSLMKNLILRLSRKKEILVIAFIIVPIIIVGVALMYSQKETQKSKIALVTSKAVEISEDEKLKIDLIAEEPDIDQLIEGNYDYVVKEDETGHFVVSSVLKSKENIKIIEDYFNNGASLEKLGSKENERNVASGILGAIVMMIIMEGCAITGLYPEDRSLRTLKRIMTTPVTPQQYILAQGLITFICLYIPTFIAVAIAKICLGSSFYYGYGILAVLLLIITALATAFSFFISSLVKENIQLTASLIAVVTSLLGSCFIAFECNNFILKAICEIVPQTQYMRILDGITEGKSLGDFKMQIIYVIVWIGALSMVGVAKIKETATN